TATHVPQPSAIVRRLHIYHHATAAVFPAQDTRLAARRKTRARRQSRSPTRHTKGEITMSEASLPKRREFLGRVAAGAVALGLSGSIPRAFAEEARLSSDLTPSDKWLTAVTGKYRQIFDAP